MSKIYYAHHIYKYGTKVEEYELNLIRQYYPGAEIINPATEVNQNLHSEADIMEQCFSLVEQSDLLVFSSMDGVVGKGVYDEIHRATESHIPIYYIQFDQIVPVDNIEAIQCIESPRSNRFYANVVYNEI